MTLVTVQGDMVLEAVAASAWSRLKAAAVAATGITPVLSSPAGAWRSEELVVDMWRNPKKYGASQGVARPISYGGGGSVHQNGLCVDINNWRAFGGLVLHRGFWRSSVLDGLCAAHGFHMDSRYPNEPWHYQHNGTAAAGGDATSFEEGDDEMASNLSPLVILGADNDGVRFTYRPGGDGPSYYEDGSPASQAHQARVYAINNKTIVTVPTKADAQALVDEANVLYRARTGITQEQLDAIVAALRGELEAAVAAQSPADVEEAVSEYLTSTAFHITPNG